MANLPTIDAFRPTPRSTGRVQVDATPDTTMQSISGGLTSFGQSYAEARNSDDKVKVENAYNKLQQRKIDLSIGEGGYSGVLSESAATKPVYKDYMEKFGNSVSELSIGLENDNQRKLFESRADIAKMQYGAGLVTHVSAQKKVYANQVYTSGIAVEQQTAIASSNPAGIASSIERTNNLIDQQASSEQWPANVKKMKKLEASSDIHVGIINNLLAAENEQGAEEYYKKNKKGIQATSYDDLERALDAGSIRGQSQSIADDIVDQGLSVRESREKVRELTKDNPKLRDATNQRVSALIDERKSSLAAERKESLEVGAKIAMDTGDHTKIPGFENFTAQEQRALFETARLKRTGEFVVNNDDLYYTLRRAASSGSTDFMTRNIEVLDKPFLDRAHFEEIFDLQMGLRTGNANAQSKVKDIQSQDEVIDSQLSIMGIDIKDKDKLQEINTIKSIIYRRIDALQKGGEKLKSEDIQGVVDAMIIKGEVKTPWYQSDEDKRLYEVYGTEMQGAFSPTKVESMADVPIVERTKMIEALKANGMDPTPEKMMELYNRKIQAQVNVQ